MRALANREEEGGVATTTTSERQTETVVRVFFFFLKREREWALAGSSSGPGAQTGHFFDVYECVCVCAKISKSVRKRKIFIFSIKKEEVGRYAAAPFETDTPQT